MHCLALTLAQWIRMSALRMYLAFGQCCYLSIMGHSNGTFIAITSLECLEEEQYIFYYYYFLREFLKNVNE